MIEQLKSAGEELRTAWNRYKNICLSIGDYYPQGKVSSATHNDIANQLDTELIFLSTYQEDVKWAQVGISQARNYSVSLSPVSCLPPEILTRIFSLLFSEDRSMNLLSTDWDSGYKYLGYLTQVCSRWRRIATSCPHLWTSIHFPSRQPHSRYLARAKIHAKRSSKLPLTVNIDDSHPDTLVDSLSCATEYRQLWDSIADQVEALCIHVSLRSTTGGFERFKYLLEQVVLSPSSRGFYKLVIDALSAGQSISVTDYITSSNTSITNKDLVLSASQSQIENKFAGITVLQLRGCFPPWSSTAYHGLVDLRLYPNLYATFITESQLHTILQLSPRMRILHLSIPVVAGSDTQTSPVPLHSLEILKIPVPPARFYLYGQLGITQILQLLGPGSKPLRLLLDMTGEQGDTHSKIQEFLQHSKVEKLCIRGLRRLSEQFISTCLTPHLKVLVFDWCDVSNLAEILGSGYMFSAAAPNLESWYFARTTMMKDSLQQLAVLFPKRIHIDQRCKVSISKNRNKPFYMDMSIVEFPAVGKVHGDFTDKLIADWDVLD